MDLALEMLEKAQIRFAGMGKSPKIWVGDYAETDFGSSADDLAAAQKRMEFDRLAPLDLQLGWLESAGFQDVDYWYKNFSFVVFGGYRGTV